MVEPSSQASAAHQRRDIAESFGTDAERYDRSRPTYPPALVDAVLGASPGRTVLDVGIGTGISARPFRDAGCAVVGVEADERMAQVARDDGFEVEVSRFEEWDPAGRVFDTVIAGQSWHWVDPVAGAAQAAAVLRPGGMLAVFWNAGDPEPRVASAFAAIYRAADTGLPFTPFQGSAADSYAGGLDTVVRSLRATGQFDEPRRWRADWETTTTRDAWLDQVPTMGGSAQIAPARLRQILVAMGEAIEAVGGAFTMRYATLAVLARRR